MDKSIKEENLSMLKLLNSFSWFESIRLIVES